MGPYQSRLPLIGWPSAARDRPAATPFVTAARSEDPTGPAVSGHGGQPSVERVGTRTSAPAEMGVGTHQHDLGRRHGLRAR
jgi:hypothetical protein